jgi:hypothetical protein
MLRQCNMTVDDVASSSIHMMYTGVGGLDCDAGVRDHTDQMRHGFATPQSDERRLV